MRGDAWHVEIEPAAAVFNLVQEEGKKRGFLYDLKRSLFLVWDCKSELGPLKCSEKALSLLVPVLRTVFAYCARVA